MILRQGALLTIWILMSVRRMIRSVQRVVFRMNRGRMTAKERVPRLNLARNAQKTTTAVRQGPTYMAFTTKTHWRVLRVIAPPSILLWIWFRQDLHWKTAIALHPQGTRRKRSDMNLITQAQIYTSSRGEISLTAAKPMVILMTILMTISTARSTQAICRPTPQGQPPPKWSTSLVL